MKFPRSTYYKALVRVPSNQQKDYEEFGWKVKQIYEDSKQRYGAVKICHNNHHTNHGSVSDDKVNILKRDFETETISQKWCTDITYIHVQKEGWTCLASVMDLCSRKNIGYAYGTSMMTELAVQAVKNACLDAVDTKGIILHSNLGSHYTGQIFENYLPSR